MMGSCREMTANKIMPVFIQNYGVFRLPAGLILFYMEIFIIIP